MSGIETCRNFVAEGPQLDKLMTADEKSLSPASFPMDHIWMTIYQSYQVADVN